VEAIGEDEAAVARQRICEVARRCRDDACSALWSREAQASGLQVVGKSWLEIG
jgi:hypothetical protein